MPSTHFLVSALLATAVTLTSAKLCPPLGRTLPPPQSPSSNAGVKSAATSLANELQTLFSSTLKASGVSVSVKSLHEDAPLFNYHFTPPVLSGVGTSKIDEHTIYRVGSISKMMPALAALQRSEIDMHASVLKYLPDLRTKTHVHPDIHAIPWEDITVDSLASHLAGLPTDMATDLAVFPNGPWTKMGLPTVRPGTGPDCSGLPGTTACTPQDILNEINRKAAVYKPYNSPVYSNTGYAVLGMVVEAATGQKFDHVVQQGIFDVAGMKSTSFNGPVSSFTKTGFIPRGESTWNATLGVFEAAGGMFSNTVDLIAFSEAILSHKLLTPVKTRQWMKPRAHTASLGYSVGAPWEILRSDALTADGRVIDVYTKSGDLGLYHALLGVVPEYDISVSVIMGGPEVSLEPHARTETFSKVVQTLFPAIDKASRDEASSEDGFVGTFVDKHTNSSLTLVMDDGPGLLIKEFKVRNFDVLGHIPMYSLGSTESGLSRNKTIYIEGRLYPADMTSSPGEPTRNHTKEWKSQGPSKEVWRAAFETMKPEQKKALDDKLFYKDGSCESWFTLDRSSYNFLSLGEFQFVKDQHGVVKAITNPAFDVMLGKVGKS